jgi:hypothetical protein
MLSYVNIPGQRYWLLAVFIVWAVFLFGGFLFGNASSTHRMPTWTRMASSVTLVVAGFSWVVVSEGGNGRSFALFLAIGMVCGLLGDLILAGLLPGGRNVLGGIAAFGVGHIFYISGIVRFSSQMGLNTGSARWGALAVWLLIGVIGWYFFVYRGQEITTLHWAALPYALLLASTAGVATGLALQSSLFIPLAVGAALFLLSDLILAAELFTGLSFSSIGDVVWLTYGPGQMLIVYAAGAAYRFLQ